MYRALYAYKSKLPKYLSFESGDRFTLIDTSISDQWFLAQNGMGHVGYVPFNYIKKLEATIEQVVKFIDGAIEAIHLQAGDDGSYTQEQRLCLKKLIKHRSDVIKRATLREKSPKGGSKRRPAPAPPVEKSLSVDATTNSRERERPSNLAVVGRSATIAASTKVVSDKGAEKHRSKTLSSNSKDSKKNDEKDKGNTPESVSDGCCSNVESSDGKNDVRKSRSVTSSIGQAPSVISSPSSLSTDNDADTISEASSDIKPFNGNGDKTIDTDFVVISQRESDLAKEEYDMRSEKISDQGFLESYSTPKESGNVGQMFENQSVLSQSDDADCSSPSKTHQVNANSAQVESLENTGNSDKMKHEEIATPTSQQRENIATTPLDKVDQYDLDLPPPPPDLQPGCTVDDDGDYGYSSYSLPPAPDDNDMLANDADGGGCCGQSEGAGAMVDSDDSDSLDVPAAKAIRECSCDDVQSKFDIDGPFTACGLLSMPAGRRLDLRKREKRDVEMMHKTIASSAFLSSASSLSSPSSSSSSLSLSSADAEKCEKDLERLERLQAYLGVTVTHADCEEMIGQFRHVSHLSHDESHWALLSAMSLLANNLPHVKPSLEILALKFKMAHQCPSTGKGYQCEDARTLENLVGQPDSVMADSQQRGHYLADDLGDIIDIITTLSETLNKAKPCVSVAAIQNDNYAMIDVIAKYYQMETRWLIHSCLLQLVEAICCLHPQAITEFLYSQLPLELVAEMQQHSHDDIRFLQVSRALGIVYMRGKASPHRLALTTDLHFFIWLLGMIEGFSERGRHDDVEMLVALVCSYHLQHRDDPQNPVTEALKMAQGHALLESALSFLSKHNDPTRLLNCGIMPRLNSVVLLLTHLYESSDTSDLLYSNDVDALVGIFEEVFRDLSTKDSLHRQMLKLLSNFLRCYPDTMSIKASLCSRLGPLLHDMKDGQGLAQNILDHNRHIFEEP